MTVELLGGISPSILLERMNASLSIAFLCALVIFVRYMWARWNEGYIFLRPAIAFSAIWAGDFYMRSQFWFARHSVNLGFEAQPSDTHVFLANLFLIGAVLCCIRVFSKTKEGHWPWIISLILIVGVAWLSPLV